MQAPSLQNRHEKNPGRALPGANKQRAANQRHARERNRPEPGGGELYFRNVHVRRQFPNGANTHAAEHESSEQDSQADREIGMERKMNHTHGCEHYAHGHEDIDGIVRPHMEGVYRRTEKIGRNEGNAAIRKEDSPRSCPRWNDAARAQAPRPRLQTSRRKPKVP